MDLEKIIATAPEWYHGYIRSTGTTDFLTQLHDQMAIAEAVFGKQFFDRAHYRYAEGKWTPCEMLGHLIDAERVFAYRAMRFARKDETPLPGFEEDDWVAAAQADARSIEGLLEEFLALRKATIAQYRYLTEEEKWRGGISNGNYISVIALFYATVGHFSHHLGVLQSRYI